MEPIVLPVIVGIVISSISGAIIAIMKRRWKKSDKKIDNTAENTKAIRDVQRSIWRLNKTVLIMAKIIDDQTAKIHPDLTSSLEDIASELLKESDD